MTRTKGRLETTDPVQVFEGRFEAHRYGKANWGVAADGRILLTSRQSYTLAPQINVILGWPHP